MAMAYLRRTTTLPSGNMSRYYVFGAPNGIFNMDLGKYIPYPVMRKIMKMDGVIGELERRLELNREEAEHMAGILHEEKKKGEWENPFEWEDGKSKHNQP